MGGSLIIQGIPIDEFMSSLSDIITEKVDAAVKKTKSEELLEKFLSPDQTRKLFNPAISLVTLSDWASKGLIKKHYISGRTYYKYSEIIEAVKWMKPYSKKGGVQ